MNSQAVVRQLIGWSGHVTCHTHIAGQFEGRPYKMFMHALYEGGGGAASSSSVMSASLIG